MDYGALLSHGLELLNLGFVGGIFFRLGVIGATLKEHDRRLSIIERTA
ncbi:MAG TPA: hypothetical protein VNE82_03545 [Candidatus Binataceae bacterium]|nr:hypothetical protein [Candidatus Binataceae bacterium]